MVGKTRADTLFGAGYVQAEDRLFEMDVLRHLGRADLSEFVGPSFISADRAVWMQSDYSEAELAAQVNSLPKRYGALGAQAVKDENDYVSGINAYIGEARKDLSKLPAEYAALGKTPEDWKLSDSVAVAAEINQGFDLGGGAEADRRAAARRAAGQARAQGGHARLRRHPPARGSDGADDDLAALPVRQRSREVRRASRPRARIAGSLQPREPFVGLTERRRIAGAARGGRGGWAGRLARSRLTRGGGESYAYLVGAGRTTSGHPVADMGPQVNFFSPELLSEIELSGPGIGVRGAALPGALPVPIVGPHRSVRLERDDRRRRPHRHVRRAAVQRRRVQAHARQRPLRPQGQVHPVHGARARSSTRRPTPRTPRRRRR